MAVLPRKLQTIFAGNLAASGNVAQPGSTVGGTPVYSNDLDVLQDLTAGSGSPWVNGLQAQVEGTQAQVLEEMNGVLLEITQQLAYLLERGQSEYLATQNYYLNAIATVSGVPYISLQDNNLNNTPASSPTWWAPWFSAIRTPATLSGFVVFDGTTGSIGSNCTILNSSNIASVKHVATGVYLITFINAMTVDGSGNGIYGFTGSAGTRNGVSAGGGDNNVINGGGTGTSSTTGIKTATTCQVYCWEANNSGVGTLEDSGSISINFFG